MRTFTFKLYLFASVSTHNSTLSTFSNRVLKRIRHVVMGAEFSVLNKLAQRGENHFKSYHIESFDYQQGVLRGEVHASMKKEVYKSR